MNFLLRLLASGALIGCGPRVEDVCKRLAKACPDVSEVDCVGDGKVVEARAKAANCQTFDDYVRCVDDSLCAADDACAELRDELSSCVGGFP